MHYGKEYKDNRLYLVSSHLHANKERCIAALFDNTYIEIYTYQLSNPNGLLWGKTKQNNPLYNNGEQGERDSTILLSINQGLQSGLRFTTFSLLNICLSSENARI